MNDILTTLATHLRKRFESVTENKDCIRLSFLAINPEDFVHINASPIHTEMMMRSTGYSITVTLTPTTQKAKITQEPTTLQVMHRMVSDSNNGISLATTIAEVKGTKQGVVVGFGMQEQFAAAANMEWMGVGSDTIFLAFTINRDQLAKTKAKMMEE